MNVTSATAKAYRALARGHAAEAADHARRILERSPDDAAALTLIGRLALASGEPGVAHRIARRILAKHPQTAALWLDLARSLRELGRHRQAAEAALRAVTVDPRDSAAWLWLGQIRLSLNEQQQAGEAFRRALALSPASVAACRGICQASGLELDPEIVQRMKALTMSPRTRRTDLAGLHYALAEIFRHAGRREEFIRHLFTANAIQRSLCTHGRPAYTRIFDRIESAFTKEAFAAAARAVPFDPSPIFVLGMPRAGTTLLEQILARHADVAAGGELNYMRGPLRRAVERHTGRPFPEAFETLPAAAMNAIARAFATRLRAIGAESRFVTDKTPGNFHVLGLLRTLFPRARIVHVARDPMDTCFSILQYQFDDHSPHTCDVGLLAYVYARYLRLMSRWHEISGSEFSSIQYERLVTSPVAESKRIFEHCGLEWSDSCLEFNRSDTAIRTFSHRQARRPIYQSSVGAWREFTDELAPLRRALQLELKDVPAIG